MKMRSVLLVCLMLMASRALCQNPEPIGFWIVAKQMNGLPYCSPTSFQGLTFTGGFGSQKYTNDIIGPGTYNWTRAGAQQCVQPVQFNQFILSPLGGIANEFPSYLNVKIEESIFDFTYINNASREVTYLLSSGTVMPQDFIVHRNTNPVAPHEQGVFVVVDGYIITANVNIPKLPVNGFYTYNNPAQTDNDKFDRFCYGDRLYVDNFYKRPNAAIRYSRFRYELTIPGQGTRTFVTNDVTGKLTGGIPIEDPNYPDIQNVVTAKLRVQMIGPELEFGIQGLNGPWSDPQDIIIYPRPPAIRTLGLNPATPLSNHASLTEVNTDNTVELHHAACNNSTTGQIAIKKLTDYAAYHVFIENTITHEHMDYKAFWSPTAGHPITLPDDAFNDPGNANTPFRFGAGTYYMKIQTINLQTMLDFGCFSEQTFTIKQASPLQLSATPSNYNGFSITCLDPNGTGLHSEDATVQVTPTGGITPYTFSLESKAAGIPGPTRQLAGPGTTTFTNLPGLVGTNRIEYKATAVDNEGCPTTLVPPAMLMKPPPKITIQQVDDDYLANHNYNVRCFGGNGDTQVFIKGGTHIFSTWIDGNGYNDYQHRNNLIDSLNQVIYTGLAATTPASNYFVHALDKNGCHSQLEFTFKQPDKLVVESSTITPVDCPGGNTGAITLNAAGGVPFTSLQNYKYSLTGKPDQVDVEATYGSLLKGTYNIVVTDVHGCTQTFAQVVPEPPAIALTTLPTDVICFGNPSGTVKATFTGGTAPYTFDWLDGNKNTITSLRFPGADNTTITDRGAGQYYARITDGHSCVKESVFIIAQPSAPLDITANPGGVKSVTCNGMTDGTAMMEVAGGWAPYSIGESLGALQPGGFNRTNLTPGVHTIYVSDLKGCVDSFDVTIGEPTPLAALADDVKPVSCFGDSDGAFTPDVTGGTEPYYMFSNTQGWIPVARVSGLLTGNTTIDIRDSKGCATTANALIPTPQVLTASLTTVADTKCGEANGGAQVNVLGGTTPYSADWLLTGKVISNEVNPTGLPAGIYQVIIKDFNNCQASFNAGISSSDGPVIDIQSSTPVTCADGADGTAMTNASGGALPYQSVKWSTGETGFSATTLIKGPNFIAVEDNVGCIATRQVVIDGPEPIVGTFTPTLPSCFGDKNGSLLVEASGGVGPYEYKWVNTSNISATLSSIAAGTYNVSIEDSKGCLSLASFDLENPDAVEVDLTGEELLCTGQTAVLDAGNPGSTYAWTSTNGFTSTQRVIEAATTGVYTVVVTDPRGCKGTDTFELRVDSDILQADVLVASEAVVGDTVILINITFPLPDSSHWEFPDGGEIVGSSYYTQEVVFDAPGEYTALLVSKKGECRDVYEATITIIDEEPEGEGDNNGRLASLVRSFRITPNPTTGKFTMSVGLSEPQSIALDIIAMNAVSTQARFADHGKESYEINVELDVSPGMYTVVLMVGTEKLVKRIIIY